MAVGHIAVIGAGAWGTALSVHLARRGEAVRLWVREPELVERMRQRRDNPTFLPGVSLPDGIEPVERHADALAGATLVIAVVPSQFARDTYGEMAPELAPGVPVLTAAKGIEEGSLALPREVAAEMLPRETPLAVLSGPTFAREIAEGRPAAMVIASERLELAVRLQATLASPRLRLYTNVDPLGVQLAAALKNVMAIAAGVLDGLECGSNALAALVTRGLAEMSRLGRAMGGSPATFSGLAGLGDLVLTCTDDQSRNRTVGLRLGRGERLDDILASSRSVAEGVSTTRSARALAKREGVEMPIVEQVYRILYEDRPPQEAVDRLMKRPLTAEDAPR